MTEITLDGLTVGPDRPPYVIAEIGHNHMGSVEECKRLIEMARDAGANAVKLQKRDNATLYTKRFYASPYNSPTAYAPTYGEHRDFLEFSLGQFLELQEYSNYLGITFIATAFDLPSVDFLEAINVPYYKVASGSVTNPLLLRKIASLGKPVVVSGGGATLEEIERAVLTLSGQGSPVVVLHCVAAYPPKPEEMNLGRITELLQLFPEAVVGFSDHDDGISLGTAAFVLGARVFEKHITNSHTNRGTDHAFSLEYMGLRAYINNLHEAGRALEYRTHPQDSEIGPIRKMGSAVYTNKDLEVGDIVTPEDIVLKSPAEGLGGWEYDKLIGLCVREPIKKEEPLSWQKFEGGV